MDTSDEDQQPPDEPMPDLDEILDRVTERWGEALRRLADM